MLVLEALDVFRIGSQKVAGERPWASGHIWRVEFGGKSTVCLHLEKYTGAGCSNQHILGSHIYVSQQ